MPGPINRPRKTQINLDGSASLDADGQNLSYQWSLLSTPEASQAQLNSPDTVKPSFAADRPGIYLAQLIVSDGLLTSDPDTVSIEIPGALLNHAPIIQAMPLTQATVGQTYSYALDARDPDPGDSLTYLLIEAPSAMTLSSNGQLTWTPTPSDLGSVAVSLEVRDSFGAKAQQSFTVAVQASDPGTRLSKYGNFSHILIPRIYDFG